ncbi:MAG: hypothetical protein QXU97_06005 [Fervidicoccaceae archaeon]
MRYRFLDHKRRLLELKIESPDDLWILRTLVRPGDVITARTTREVKPSRGGPGRRVPMILSIRVSSLEFQPFTNRLRIRGVIVEEPEEYGLLGSHHTLAVGVGSELLITREEGWSDADLKRLSRTMERRKRVVVLAIDHDEYAVGIVGVQGLKILTEKALSLHGKARGLDQSDEVERALEEAVQVVLTAAEREEADVFVVGGPGFLKERAAEILSTRVGPERVLVDDASSGGSAGLVELVRRGAPLRAAEAFELEEAEKTLEEALRLMTLDPAALAVGLSECGEAAKLGAVEKLLIVDDLLSTFDVKLRSSIEEVLEIVDEKRGAITVVPSKSPAGERLLGLGGVLCLLRFRLST